MGSRRVRHNCSDSYITNLIKTTLIFHSEKAMAPHSSTLAWKTPWTEEPGRLQSMGSLRVEHDWATSLSLFTSMHWRRKWQPTPVFLPGESQGQGSLVGCLLWGRTYYLMCCSPYISPLLPLGWTGQISLQSKGLSRVFCNTTVQRHQFFSAQLSL